MNMGNTNPISSEETQFLHLKLYMPMSANVYSEESECNRWDGEFGPEEYELFGKELSLYAEQIIDALSEFQMPEEEERGIMHWYHEEDSVNQKVQSVVFTAEIRDNALWGIADCCLNSRLNTAELTALKDYISGQASDGWGESFEQHPLDTDLGEMYVHLWSYGKDWFIKSEAELFPNLLAEGLPETCFSTLRSSGELIIIKRGESGYYLSDWNTPDRERNKEIAEMSNQSLGVTPAQKAAMECGSMFGWSVPGADPRAYEEDLAFCGMSM